MTMKPISVEEAIAIAKKKGLKPARVKGTDGIQFTKGEKKALERLAIISWDEFRKVLKERKLQVYEAKGWMKIMRK